MKKRQIRQIQGSASLSLRKCKTKGKTLTAGDLKSEGSVNKLINLDEGFRVLRNLLGSPPSFERCKKDLFAMIRQLGNPTWFCSFSPAETRWAHLIKILCHLIDNKDYTGDEVRQMSWQRKSELIQNDPVNVQEILNIWCNCLFITLLKVHVTRLEKLLTFSTVLNFSKEVLHISTDYSG